MRATVVFVMVLAVLATSASWAADKPFSLGLKGGVNLASVAIDPEPEQPPESLLRFSGGAGLCFNLQPGMSFDLDLLYLQKGAKASYGDGSEASWLFDYFVASPMLRFGPGRRGAGPYLMAGGEVGYLFQSVLEVVQPGMGKDEVDIRDELEDLDYGLNFGAGLEFPVGRSGGFFLEGHYSLGLADISINQEPEQGIQETSALKTRGIYGFAGIRF